MDTNAHIYSCPVIAPSLERASRLAPREYRSAWGRFIEYEGRAIDKLPWSDEPMGANLDVLLVSQRGIHTPGYSKLSAESKLCPRYALSIHTSGNGPYADRDVIYRPDGTWILDYKAHRTAPGKKETDASTTFLMNCLTDGIPVGVFSARPKNKGYDVLGLGYVEQYSYETDSFVIHGPINAETEASKVFFQLQPEELSAEDRAIVDQLQDSEEDEKIKKLVEQVQREGQSQFRQQLMEAYDHTCAATGEIEAKVLQAAHIDPYRGKKSQVVTNGLLLRADIHLLYDADLLSVKPDSHEIVIADALTSDTYTRLAGQRIRLPRNKALWPDDGKLELHHRQFKLHQHDKVA